MTIDQYKHQFGALQTERPPDIQRVHCKNWLIFFCFFGCSFLANFCKVLIFFYSFISVLIVNCVNCEFTEKKPFVLEFLYIWEIFFGIPIVQFCQIKQKYIPLIEHHAYTYVCKNKTKLVQISCTAYIQYTFHLSLHNANFWPI